MFCLLERPIALRKAYVDLPTSPLAPTSMAKRWTPYPLASRSIVRSKYRSLFKALLRSILSSHGTANSTRSPSLLMTALGLAACRSLAAPYGNAFLLAGMLRLLNLWLWKISLFFVSCSFPCGMCCGRALS